MAFNHGFKIVSGFAMLFDQLQKPVTAAELRPKLGLEYKQRVAAEVQEYRSLIETRQSPPLPIPPTPTGRPKPTPKPAPKKSPKKKAA